MVLRVDHDCDDTDNDSDYDEKKLELLGIVIPVLIFGVALPPLPRPNYSQIE